MNELTVKQDVLVKKLEQNGLGNVIKPLIKEFLLLDVFVHGLTFDPPPELSSLSVGDELTLKRERMPYDEYTVSVLTNEGAYLGEVHELYNEILARLMDAGKILKARVKNKVVAYKRNLLEISVFLSDY